MQQTIASVAPSARHLHTKPQMPTLDSYTPVTVELVVGDEPLREFKHPKVPCPFVVAKPGHAFGFRVTNGSDVDVITDISLEGEAVLHRAVQRGQVSTIWCREKDGFGALSRFDRVRRRAGVQPPSNAPFFSCLANAFKCPVL